MLHVYKIPEKRSDGYCFAGPVPIPFGNIDWMDDPPAQMSQGDVEHWLRKKGWFTKSESGSRFLVLCDRPGFTFQMVRE